jgi:membrane-associated phospholipid phosphatase
VAGAGVLVSAAFIVLIVAGKPLLLKAQQTLLDKRSASKNELTETTTEASVPEALLELTESTEVSFPEAFGTTTPVSSQEIPSKASPPMYQLPFHISLFEDVPFHKQALFVVWISTLGPLLLVIRLALMLIVVSIKGTHGVFEPWFYMSVLNWFIDIQCDGEELKQDGRPVVFLSNHHLTHDIVVVTMATKTHFGMNGKVLVHPKIYNSFFFRYFLGSKRDMSFVTSTKSVKYLDIFHDWIEQQLNKAQGGMALEALSLAPAGMTTHERMITSMHWKYFASSDTIKVLVNVDVSNLFGVKMRNLSGGSFASQFIILTLPWVSATVTYHTDAVPDVVTSQEQVDDIVSKLYKEKHGKDFAAGWTQRMRRDIDKYLNHGEFIPFPASSHSSERNVECVSLEGDVPPDLKARLPVETRIVTSSLVGNKSLRDIAELETSEIALVNPKTMADEILASVYKIPMAKSEVSDLDAFEARLSVGVQGAFDFSVLNFAGKLLHYILLEKNLILLATLLLGSGMWVNQLLLLGQIVALAHIWLLLLKIIASRPRPVWLPARIRVQSFVNDIQGDGSFPSGHSGFFTLIAAAAWKEQRIFSSSTQVIFTVCAGITALERVKLGAHFVSDVLGGVVYAILFVVIFYAAGGDEHLLHRTEFSDLKFQVHFTIAFVMVQLLSIFLANTFRREVSALDRATYFQNNLQRLSVSAQKELLRGKEKPLGLSRDFLSPFLGISAVVFWVQPLIADTYYRSGSSPVEDVPGSVRLFGAVSAMAFIIAIVLPTRKLVGRKLKENHMTRFFVLAITYMVMLIFAAIYCHFSIQAVLVLRDKVDG